MEWVNVLVSLLYFFVNLKCEKFALEIVRFENNSKADLLSFLFISFCLVSITICTYKVSHSFLPSLQLCLEIAILLVLKHKELALETNAFAPISTRHLYKFFIFKSLGTFLFRDVEGKLSRMVQLLSLLCWDYNFHVFLPRNICFSSTRHEFQESQQKEVHICNLHSNCSASCMCK